MIEVIRIDKWLWAVRLFKTRSLAADTCRNGKVWVNNIPVKPSYEMKEGLIIQVRFGLIIKTVKVLKLTANRLSAKLVPDFMLDMTSPEEYKKLEIKKDVFFVKRERGTGRPTKKERRDINQTFPDW
ncbi:MAG TPA: RNA-binding S4 domain-containing protein [Bacteroidales bacterium]|nr:RNA-binding S4 domain-containing protein [Bacteroidales bacterium]HQI46161.1 RNA-binding S4 domain-containing protein [Bacteroidales bacterium]